MIVTIYSQLLKVGNKMNLISGYFEWLLFFFPFQKKQHV